MGTWGADILDDDVAVDVYGEFMERFERGEKPARIQKAIEKEFKEHLNDSDDMPNVWFALAKAQWEIGSLEPNVFAKVAELIKSGQGMDSWEHAGEEAVRERQSALNDFLAQLQNPNPEPLKRT